MPKEDFPFLFNKTDKRYSTIWLAVLNPREFQRLAIIENCEIERISVESICDEIILQLRGESDILLSTEADNQKPMLSFLMASQLFIGLIYVHEQQVKFLCESVSRWTLPTKFIIENEPQYVLEEDSSSSPPVKKALKRKTERKERKILIRRISVVFDRPEELEDIMALNHTTAELLQNAFVSNNDDISIREVADDYGANEINGSADVFDVQFNEVTVNSEPPNFDDDLLGEGLLASQIVDETEVSWKPPTHDHFKLIDDTICGETDELENTGNSGGPANMMNDEPEINSIEIESLGENAVPNASDEPEINAIEMESLDENSVPNITNVSARKRKRKRNQPFKDRILNIDVKQNMRTVSTTQRHSKSKDDSVSKTTRLNHLSRDVFNIPSHVIVAETSVRQFELKPVSDKLMESFKRMTITKTEETNHNLINEFCTNQSDITLREVNAENSEHSIVDAPVHYNEAELSQSLQINDVVEESLTIPSIPDLEEMLQDSGVEPPNIYQHEPVELLPPEPPNIYQHEPVELLPAEPPNIYQHEPVELLPAVRQLLLTNQTSTPFTNNCVTESQKLCASRSRQNRLDWGTEGVLQKLMSLWTSGIYPIGMKEIMQNNNQRISAATAFFSVMELNSARIGLINIVKSPNSNNIFNIMKSQKLIELQDML